jgi:hypothetical protein
LQPFHAQVEQQPPMLTLITVSSFKTVSSFDENFVPTQNAHMHVASSHHLEQHSMHHLNDAVGHMTFRLDFDGVQA